MAARRNACSWLASLAVAVGFVSVVDAEVKNIAAGPPPPPLYYASFGVVQVNWTFALTAGTTVTGFEVTVRPLDHTEQFTVAPPSGKNPWFWDNGNYSASSYAFSGTAVTITANGVSDSPVGRGLAPYLYRKIPEGAIFDLAADCANSFATHPTSQCGLVVFHAGWNTQLGSCGLVKVAGITAMVMADAFGSNRTFLTDQAGAPWGTSAVIRASWDEVNKALTCTAATTAAGLAGSGIAYTMSQTTRTPEVLGGDLWYGMFLRTAGGSAATMASASFDWVRVWRPVPGTKPATVNGGVDTCFTKATVQAEMQAVAVAGDGNYSVTFSTLSQNFPYTVDVAEVRSDGSRVIPADFVPHVFARPMPPRPWALGAWYDSRTLKLNTKVSQWPDTSGWGHHAQQAVAARQPQVIASQYTMQAVQFNRAAGHYLSSGSDAIDLGGATPFSIYMQTLLTTSSPGILAGRGINQRVEDMGYAVMEYSDQWNPWPGTRGVRVTDQAGAYAASHFDNLQRWGYLYQTNHVSMLADRTALPGSAANNIYPHNPKQIQFYRTKDVYGEASALKPIDFPGFPGGALTNSTNYTQPLTVDWSSGTAVPAISEASVNFKIGGPIVPAGDIYRSMGGQMFSVMTYREQHNAGQRQDTFDFSDWYNLRRCYGIVTPNSNNNAAVCGSGYRDDYCYQSCPNLYAQTAGTNDHWCQGGRWTGAPAVCKKQCGTFARPNFIKSCVRVYLSDSFSVFSESWNRYLAWPYMPDVQRDLSWSLKDGVMRAFTNDPCKQTLVSHMALHPNRWDLIIPYGGLQTVTARVRLDKDTSIAGLSVHFQSETYNYLFTISKTNGLILYRNTNVEVARDSTIANRITVGEWFDFQVSVNNLWAFTANIGNTTVFTARDNTGAGPTWGAAGMFADGWASFMNFSIAGSCDGNGNCLAMSSGQQCSYECDLGYKTVSISNGVVSCDDTGLKGSMQCLTLPPDFPTLNFYLAEHTSEGILVGRVIATPANPRQQIDYSIVGAWPSVFNNSFEIGSCSGAILVKAPGPDVILYRYYRNITLAIKARPDGDEPGSKTTNFTIIIVDVDMPPVFTPSAQFMSVPENYKGYVGTLSTYDEDYDVLLYSFLLGNDAGFFSINVTTGDVYTAMPLDFESQAMWSTLVQAAEVRNRGMLGTAPLTITVIDVNDPPQMQSSQVFIDESVLKQPSAVGMLVSTMVAFDPDNATANPSWANISYSFVSNIYNGSQPLLSLNVVNGQAQLLLTRELHWYDDSYDWYGNTRVRAVQTAIIAACDHGTPPMCTNASVTVVQVANFTFPFKPVILSMPRSADFVTQGGEPLVFQGRDFAEVYQANATYCSLDAASPRCYVARTCSKTIAKTTAEFDTITCLTVPGWGTNLAINLTVWTATNGQNVFRLVPLSSGLNMLTLSYADPVLDRVQLQSGTMDTAGGAVLNITGRNLGPNDTSLAITFGVNQEFSMQRIYSFHTYILARLMPGCGANLPVQVVIGGTQRSRSTNEFATMVSFAAPSITTINVTVGSAYSTSTLPTNGGATLIFTGRGFGPASANGMDLMPTSSAVNSEPNPMRYSVACKKDPATAHTVMTCDVPKGVGFNFTWTTTVCGLSSAPSKTRTAYAPPIITTVGGAGKTGASTQGGQLLSLSGQNLGYVPDVGANDDMTRIVRWVRYGAPGRLQYTAESCRVTISGDTTTRVECLTAEGTGKNHSIQINIGGQISNLYPASISYAEPVISAFGLARLAQTPGGEEIQIQGSNFGKDISLVTVFYTARPVVVRAYGDHQLPGDPPGVLTYYPRSCWFVVNHTEIHCTYNEGGGRKLVWDMIVDTQQSASPTTAYDVPVIANLTLLDGAVRASTRGGTRVRLSGVNFGLGPLIQAIRYGPVGTELLVANFTYVSHYAVIVTLPPGTGSALHFTIQVADQLSEPSVTTFDYASPVITRVSPALALTNYDPLRPLTITVAGRDFGLMDPLADVAIAFGNAGDQTLLPAAPLQSILSRYPPAAAVADGSFVPPVGAWEETVTFALPETLAANRSVRVVPYPRGRPPAFAAIAALPVDPLKAVFSFVAPAIDYIYVAAVSSDADKAALSGVFNDVIATAVPISMRKIEVYGKSFGPSQLVGGDLVKRYLEARDASSPTGWSTCEPGASGPCITHYIRANWTHDKIVAFSRQPAATVRVRTVAVGPRGEVSVQLSNEYGFSDVSPKVSALIGASVYPTPGGDVLTMQVSGLASTRELNVTVGGRPAQLLKAGPGNTVVAIQPNQAQADIVFAQGTPPFAADFVWTVMARIPPGEGRSQAVQVVRDGVRSGRDEQAVDYLAPNVTTVGVWDEASQAYLTQPFAPTAPLYIPTHDARLQFNGTNFGLCPSLRIVTDNPSFVDACPVDVATGVAGVNGNVSRSHYHVSFAAPQGEGTGLSVQANGWFVELVVGQQFAASGPVLLRFRSPSVASVTPAVGPTRGGITLTIRGDNFGYRTAPVVSIGTDASGWLTCLNPMRASHTLITCTLPAGVGANLLVRVSVGELAGSGGTFSYLAPSVASVTVSQLVLDVSPLALPMGFTDPVQYTWRNATVPYGVGAPTGPLMADAAGGAIITLTGSNLGPAPMAGSSCVFALWGAVLRQDAAARAAALSRLICDGLIDLDRAIGEGEVRAQDVLSWGHEAISFRLAPGQGTRKFVPLVGGQLPGPDMTQARRLQAAATPGPSPSPTPLPAPLVAEFQYATPVITEAPPSVPSEYSTKGNDTLVLGGRFFPPAYYTPAKGATSVRAAELNTTSLPFTYTVVTFADRCITDAKDWQGKSVPGLTEAPSAASAVTQELQAAREAIVAANAAAGCRVVVSTGALRMAKHAPNEHAEFDRLFGSGAVNSSWVPSFSMPYATDKLTIQTPPGIGVNRSVAIRVYDFNLADGVASLLATSNPVNFSYAPPRILGFYDGRRIVISATTLDRPDASEDLRLLVDNVGTVDDMPNWTDDERHIAVNVDDVECVVPDKDYAHPSDDTAEKARYTLGTGKNARDYVQCGLSALALRVGFHSVTLQIAGQAGTLDANDTSNALQVVCAPGLFGQPNQTCLRCPVGATCAGYVTGHDSTKVPGEVYWGSTTYDDFGFHAPAVPAATFYNLNATQYAVCPQKLRGLYPEERQVCIVGCQPQEACIGANLCAPPYLSKAPNFRCSNCNKGFFRRASQCIPCPNSPELLIAGVLCLIAAVAGLGYYLQRKKINIAMAAIGIDYFQVLAIFANSKINWPPEIRDMLQIFSAFNLNIEIVAPECLVPDVSFLQKWSAIMAIPVGVYSILLSIQGCNILYRVCLKRIKWKKATEDAGQVALASLLTLFYLLYIYLSKNVFDVMTCVPAEPDDGERYMTGVPAEPCGKPGGTQLTLLPWAVTALIVYVVGYPVALSSFFLLRRKLIMEDQLLRSRDVGDDVLTNPHALDIRKTFSRSYYAFKPDLFWWTIIILSRKMGICVTFVLFSQNPHFQLAASLLVCFVGYAAQVRFTPYMPPQEYEEVWRDHLLMSLVPGSLHAQLQVRIAEIDAKAKKAARSNRLAISKDARVNYFANWLGNANTVEAVLLFCAVLVNLMGLMYASIEGTAYASGQRGVTVCLILVIAFSIIYYILVLLGEVWLQCRARAEKEAAMLGNKKAKTPAQKSDRHVMTSADVKKAAYDAAVRGPRASTKLAMNPMFVNGGKPSDAEPAAGGEGAPGVVANAQNDAARQAIFSRVDAPEAGLWSAFKEQFADLLQESTSTAKELNNTRMQMRRVMEALNVTTVEELMAALSKLGGSIGGPSTRQPTATTRTRTAYKPMLSAAEESAAADALMHAFTAGAGAGAGAGRSSVAPAGRKATALAGYASGKKGMRAARRSKSPSLLGEAAAAEDASADGAGALLEEDASGVEMSPLPGSARARRASRGGFGDDAGGAAAADGGSDEGASPRRLLSPGSAGSGSALRTGRVSVAAPSTSISRR